MRKDTAHRNAAGYPWRRAALDDNTYDAANRLRTVNDSRGNKTLTYTYSAGGKLNQLADSEGRTTNYLYDNVGRLSGVQAPGANTADMREGRGQV